MGDHFRTVCDICGTLIAQCRCPTGDKPIRFDTCAACQARDNEVPLNGF